MLPLQSATGILQQNAEGLHKPNKLKKVDSLPFTVRVAADRASLEKAVHVRRAAYARHLPEIAVSMTGVEDADFAPGVVVLLAESKFDGEALGTMRIQTNDFQPLMLEKSVTLPSWLQGKKLAEPTRLGVVNERIGHMVKIALFKSLYLYCVDQSVDWMVIGARSPLDKDYEQLLFVDVFDTKQFFPLKHAANVPHRILAFEVASAETRWRSAQHQLLSYVTDTEHREINVSTVPRRDSSDFVLAA